jgi:oligopeptidase B
MTAVAVPPGRTTTPVEAPPRAPRHPTVRTLHGDVRTDDYAWLREREDPAVLAYLEAENRWTDAATAHTAGLRETLYQELLGRLREADQSVPLWYRGWWYSVRTEPGRPYPVYLRQAGSTDAPERVILDQNQLADGLPYHALGGLEVSPDGRWLLFLEDTTGERSYTLSLKDLERGEVVERLEEVWTGVAWADDSRTYFYMTADGARRGHAVWRRARGTPRTADACVFDEPDPLYDVGVRRSRSGRCILIDTDSFSTADCRVIPGDDPAAPPRLLLPRREGVEYRADHGPDGYYLVTNDGAPEFRVVRLTEPGGAVTEVVPARAGVFVEGIDLFRHHLVLTERVAGLRRFRVRALAGGMERTIAFAEGAYGVVAGLNPDFESAAFRFTYSSLLTPPSVYDEELATGARVLRKRQPVPGGHDPERYELRRLDAPGRDGARVPVTLLLRRGAPCDGSNPLLLHGYGAYGASVEPVFSSAVLSLVDRGFVYAIAHVRGGQELGRGWYDAGRMLRKRNTFEDFIAVAEELVRRGYTRPERLTAQGASAGGLLMGVVANERPDLFRALVAEVPFVDVVNTMLDPTLPLTAQEWEQWGNPAREEEYRYLQGYSPYDNVRPQAYPWLLVTTALHDTQVMFWEPAKWVARLRATATGDAPLLLQTHLEGGHLGPSDRYARLRETAFRYAFLLDAVGLAGGATS